jgi:MFS transporter, ACS family, glucarate transporter
VAAGAGTWTVVSDTAPKEAVGLAGSIFNGIGNIAGFLTPLLFGIIVGVTGSYSIGLVFVGAHCVVAALLFWLVMGPIERVGEEQESTATSYKKQGKEDGIKAV